MPEICPHCGGAICVMANSRIETYKGKKFMIPEVLVPTCERCNEQFVNVDIVEEMQAALEKAYQKAMGQK